MVIRTLLSPIVFVLAVLVSVTAHAETFRSYFVERNQINSQSNESVIHYAHKKLHYAPYVVVDKNKQLAQLFSETGRLVSQAPVVVRKGDELDKGGAGIYVHATSERNIHYLQAESNGRSYAIFKGDLEIAKGTRVYVLPETGDHKFRIRNSILTFNASRVLRRRPTLNYSPFNGKFKEASFSLEDADSFLRTYIETLEKEKAALMTLLNLEDDEYNMLAEFAFGVLAPETNFGRSLKYRLKQSMPVVVSILKGNGFDTEANSRGPTQMKDIPALVAEKYKLEKGNLKYPQNAAVATVAFAAELLKELRNRAGAHNGVTEENLQDYLYYLYQGRHQAIIQGTATPNQNIAIRKIKAAIELLKIEI